MRPNFALHTYRATNLLARIRLDIAPLAKRIRRGIGLRGMRELRPAEVPFLAAAWDDLRREAQEGSVDPDHIERLESQLTSYSRDVPRKAAGPAFASPAVSVSMVSRNRAHCIGDAIRSVQGQSFEDWELIVIDDGSTDSTGDVVASFSADARIRYRWQPPAGLASARNHSLRLARGALIAYLDDDNLFYPGFLAAAVGAFTYDTSVDCLYGALVTGAHRRSERTQILFEEFNRDRLLETNLIDMGVLVHRRALVEKYGGIAKDLDCYCDWDFVLRLTKDKPAKNLPVLSTRYRVMDGNRMSAQLPKGFDYFKVRRKWFAAPKIPRMPRVLYVAGEQSRHTESYVQTQLRCMRQWGVEVASWCEDGNGSSERSSDRGTLADAIAAANPDVIHIHGLETANTHADTLARSRLPVTLWSRKSPSIDPPFQDLLAQDWVTRVYCSSGQAGDRQQSPKLRWLKPVFDTSLFHPSSNKDRRLVLQVLDTPSANRMEAFFEVAAHCPSHRFVAAIVTRSLDQQVAELIERQRGKGAPGELMVGVRRDEVISLQKRAGLYLQTAAHAGDDDTTVGGAIAIAEAMATGTYILTPAGGSLAGDIGSGGRRYRTTEDAAALINGSVAWSDTEWHQAWVRSVDRSFRIFADELVFRPLFDDWCNVVDGIQ